MQSMLKTKSNQYINMENCGKHSSDCVNLFGSPSIVDGHGDPKWIHGFVSCRKCFYNIFIQAKQQSIDEE